MIHNKTELYMYMYMKIMHFQIAFEMMDSNVDNECCESNEAKEPLKFVKVTNYVRDVQFLEVVVGSCSSALVELKIKWRNKKSMAWTCASNHYHNLILLVI